MTERAPTGIRLLELRLAGRAGSAESYAVSFQNASRSRWLPLCVIAGESQTGKTSVADFVRYCLGDNEHPQHPEIIDKVRSAILVAELDEQVHTIERSAVGAPSKFASVWSTHVDNIQSATEQRYVIEPPSDPNSLSQFVLSACGLDNVALPEAPTREDSPIQLLSIRDVFRIMWVPNERLDNKNLAFEHSPHMVRQKFRQLVDVIFGVHDAAGTDLGARIAHAAEAARVAARDATALETVVIEEYPEGPLELKRVKDEASEHIAQAEEQIRLMDEGQLATERQTEELRSALEVASLNSRKADLRVRDRVSLLDRLAALRSQYADDKKKLTFLKEAERAFDPLHVQVCPACLMRLAESPTMHGGNCSLCGSTLPTSDASTPNSGAVQVAGDAPVGTAVIEAELRAVNRRLDELSDYWNRMDVDLAGLRTESAQAARELVRVSEALEQVTDLPAPFLAARDEALRVRSRMAGELQRAEAGLRLWDRVAAAKAEADRLAGHASRLRTERTEQRSRPDREAVVSAISQRFTHILQDFGYPKLDLAHVGTDLVPHVRGLPYHAASSGGLVLISLAWHLAIFELAFEQGEAGVQLLMIDSPQKNLGHRAADLGDTEFSDSRLVENFYSHVRSWLHGNGQGAQVVIVDNSPPTSVDADVVVRYSRDRRRPPYGLIHDAVD
ncbi:conserved hypothetical protein [Nostocoides australiense Ben110]|uniref:Rad50/SbcC-type AAA domain-containing protein n=1 Tax=Nostocoides australiense Ben110 TaxID=1193182 RepID=W6K1K8_9MICO|nr:DNA recombination protein RecN [Tetrasphaera australiensis]CCH74890.1 conserved hypothetical protein [Tetrasphaera australiensis Ben110]